MDEKTTLRDILLVVLVLTLLWFLFKKEKKFIAQALGGNGEGNGAGANANAGRGACCCSPGAVAAGSVHTQIGVATVESTSGQSLETGYQEPNYAVSGPSYTPYMGPITGIYSTEFGGVV